MKKLIAIILFLPLIAAPCYAFNIIDKLIYREDVLKANNRPILVNRVTGEVKYVMKNDGQWLLLEGQGKDQYQNMYNGQCALQAKGIRR